MTVSWSLVSIVTHVVHFLEGERSKGMIEEQVFTSRKQLLKKYNQGHYQTLQKMLTLKGIESKDTSFSYGSIKFWPKDNGRNKN